MLRKILIVEDNDMNREILKEILINEYDILEACNGIEALNKLDEDGDTIAAVVLDIMMPEMNGYQVLERMKSSSNLTGIPVIIATGTDEDGAEIKMLSAGANDYITKPYQPEVIRHRIRNTIKMREQAAIVNASRLDPLTGLLNRIAFFENAESLILSHAPGYYVMACYDIERFKIINDQYGSKKGDDVLRFIANVFEKGFSKVGGICARIMADHFAVLYPKTFINSAELNKIREKAALLDKTIFPITFCIGRYFVNDVNLDPRSMYDRAAIAKESVKGRFDTHIATYDEKMREKIVQEQQIISQMKQALDNNQFEVWYQPQYNHVSGAIIGSEALVRWRHPDKGYLSPQFFIPIFEKNGFVYEVDKFVWEQACKTMKEMRDAGDKIIPISVNVSRYDVLRDDIIEVITDLINKYQLPASLLRLEITESAFSSAGDHIIRVINSLKKKGFTIEIDDFGSGYSSLNTLKDVPADVIKLDMRFLEKNGNSEKGGNILESIIRMIEWIGSSVIAEGVENKEQADFLKSIGCYYMQGYLYAKPMMKEDYLKWIKDCHCEENMETLEKVENYDNISFWNPSSMDTLVFNSFVGGASVFEYNKGDINVIRTNDNYIDVIGGGRLSKEEALSVKWCDYMGEENFHQTIKAIEDAISTRKEMTIDMHLYNVRKNDKYTYIRSTMRVIARASDRFLFYCRHEDITLQQEAIIKEKRFTNQLQNIMDNLGCGVTAVTAGNSTAEILFANNMFYSMLGYTKEQLRNEITDNYMLVHPKDRDIQRELIENIPCGAGIYEYNQGKLMCRYLNQRYWSIVNRVPYDLTSINPMDLVLLSDKSYLISVLQDGILRDGKMDADIHILYGEKEYRPFHINGNLARNKDGTYTIYVTYMPITENELSFREMLPVALETMMGSSNDLSFIKDRSLKYVCASRTFALMAGLKDEKEVIGLTDYDLFDKELANKFSDDDRKLISMKKSIVDCIEVIPSDDGITHYSSTSKYLLKDSNGNIVGIYGVGRDITENKEVFERLKLLTDNIPGGLATYEITNEHVKAVYLSDGVYDIIGYAKGDFDIRNIDPMSFIMESERDIVFEQIDKLNQNDSIDCIYRICQKSGEFRWVNLKGVVVERKGTKLIVNAVLFDVTDSHNADIKLKALERENRNRYEHELQLRKGLINDSVFYYQINLSTMIIEEYHSKYNDVKGMRSGIAADEKLREALLDNVAAEDAELVKNSILSKAINEGYKNGKTSWFSIYRRKLPERGLCWVRTDVSVVEKPDTGEVVAFLHCEDIDRERRASLSIKSILDEDIESVVVVNVETGAADVVHIRNKMIDIDIHSPFDFENDYIDKAVELLVDGDKDKFKNTFRIKNMIDKLKTEKAITYTHHIMYNNVRRLKVSKAYYLDELKKTIVLMRRDVTDLYAEEQKQKSRLEKAIEEANRANHAKSDFLSRMSHDIRTPLNAVLAFSCEEMIGNASENELREYIKKVNVSGQYLLGIINDVLDMSRETLINKVYIQHYPVLSSF